MEIGIPPNTSAVTTATASNPQDDNGVLTSDFETFLVMLTAQLENQDPLNPLDSNDFAVQLATFSGVEQQVRTNDLLEASATRQSTSDLLGAAAWIGRDVKIDGQVAFAGAAVEIFPETLVGASASELVVRNENGAVLAREPMPLGLESYNWSGTGPEGAPLPTGLYSLEIESFDLDQSIGTTPVTHFTTVLQVLSDPTAPKLVTALGREIEISEVQTIAERSGESPQ